MLYNNQINARALIGQSGMVYYASKLMEKSRVFWVIIERFSFECRNTKTKVITLANHKEHGQYREPSKTRSNYM